MDASSGDIGAPARGFLRHRQGVDALALPGGDVMTVMFGVLAAMRMMWGYAGYVLVSHPGTEETGVSRRLRK
jgi:hypothetical protein